MNLKLFTVFLLFLFVASCAPKQAIKQEEQPAPPAAEELILPDISQKKVVQEEKQLVVEGRERQRGTVRHAQL
jgi:hypothetical protein